MIPRIIGFSLYYGLGVGSAVLAMVTVLPSVQLGGGVRHDVDGGAQHAIYVEGATSCPALAIADATARCPYLATVAAESRCPYLAAMTAASGCPYLAAVAAGSSGCPHLRATGRGVGCPYLEGRPDAGSDGAPPSRAPDGPAPRSIAPTIDWMPEGSVLARLEPTDTTPALPDTI